MLLYCLSGDTYYSGEYCSGCLHLNTEHKWKWLHDHLCGSTWSDQCKGYACTLMLRSRYLGTWMLDLACTRKSKEKQIFFKFQLGTRILTSNLFRDAPWHIEGVPKVEPAQARGEHSLATQNSRRIQTQDHDLLTTAALCCRLLEIKELNVTSFHFNLFFLKIHANCGYLLFSW